MTDPDASGMDPDDMLRQVNEVAEGFGLLASQLWGLYQALLAQGFDNAGSLEIVIAFMNKQLETYLASDD